MSLTRDRIVRRLSSRALIGLVLTTAVLAAYPLLRAQGGRSGQYWVGTWATAVMARVPAAPTPAPNTQPPQAAGGGGAQPAQGQGQAQSPLNFNNQTLRQIVHISLGGDRVRVVLSNTYGTAPLAIGAAQVALRDKDAAIVAGSNRVLTFSGRASATIPPGALLVSDPATLTVPALADLAIDVYLPGDTAASNSPATVHAAAWQTNYLSTTGNHAGMTNLPVQATTDFMRGALPSSTWFFLSRVEVMAPERTGAIVTIGDSITDGTQSGNNTNNRWPDHFARRLTQANIRMGVLNVGIGGNRVLSDGAGISAMARFDRDVLAQTGVTHVIVFEGINDIQGAQQNPPSAADLIAAHRQLIDRAHARGLTVYGATLTPFEGAGNFSAEKEAKRQELNQWIRTGKLYDAVIDFEAAVRDPAQPTKIRAQYDPGDHLHMNGAGYKAMADAIDLALFKPGSAIARTAAR